jgi:uncharacterized protein YqgC (DUF456 family)
VTLVDVLALLAVAVGLAGILVPVLPGSVLILGSLLAWAILVGETAGWVVFAVAAAFLAFGTIVKYAVPGRRMKSAGVPTSTLVVGAVAGIVGFFVIPVIGLPVGFVGGIYAAELRRVGEVDARRTTVAALKAVGLSILIELTAGLFAAAALVVGIVVT